MGGFAAFASMTAILRHWAPRKVSRVKSPGRFLRSFYARSLPSARSPRAGSKACKPKQLTEASSERRIYGDRVDGRNEGALGRRRRARGGDGARGHGGSRQGRGAGRRRGR